MGSRAAVLVALPVLLLLTPRAGMAGPNSAAAVALHLLSPTSKSVCARSGTQPLCGDIVTGGDLSPASYFAYVLITDGSVAEGIGGIQFGVSYAAAPVWAAHEAAKRGDRA